MTPPNRIVWQPHPGGMRRAVTRAVTRVVVSVVAVMGVMAAGTVVDVASLRLVPADCAAALVAADATAAADTIRVAVAIDPGVEPGVPRSPEAICVTVRSGASGAEVLAERARMLNRPPPRYNASGLLCAIDGYPASGCGDRVEGGFAYWSYHLGVTAQWTRAGTGPALRPADATVAEGWRFVVGEGNANDPGPRLPAATDTVCRPVAPPNPTPPAPTPPASQPAPVVAAPVNPSAGPPSGATGGPAPGGTATTPGAPDSLTPGDNDAAATSVPPVDPDSAATDPADTTDPADRPDEAVAGAPVTSRAGAQTGSGGDDTVAAAGFVDDTPGAGPVLPAVMLALGVVGLAVASVVRAHKRRPA